MRSILLGFLLSCPALLMAQLNFFQPDTTAGPHPWTKEGFEHTESSFQFAVIGDLTGGYRHGVFPQAVEKANAIAPDFVMSVGDLIEGYTEDTAQILRWWRQFDGWVAGLEAPFFYVPGNHDLSHSGMTSIWEVRYGRTYYHFLYRNVLFLVLNTEDGAPSRISPKQVRYVEQTLADHPQADWTLLFFHKPLWQEQEAGFLAIEQALQGRPYTVFAGHTHRYLKQQRHGQDYYILGTTGGGSTLAGPAFGQLDHFAWVTMRPDGPQVANLLLDGILPDDIHTEATQPLSECLLRGSRPVHDALVENSPAQLWKTNLRLAHQCPVPVRLTGRFLEHPQLEPAWAAVDTLLAPGSQWVAPLSIRANEVGFGSELDPLEWMWEVRAGEDAKGLIRSDTTEIRIVRSRQCQPAPKDVAVDGQWKEWSEPGYEAPEELGYYPHSWEGPEDCSIAARCAADTDWLYFALRVKDNEALYSSYRSSWEQDGAAFQLLLPGTEPIGISFSPGDSLLVDSQENWPAGAKIKALRLLDGFSAELALPRAALAKRAGESLASFQLQWIVYDHDGLEDQYKGTKAYWRKPGPGAGTYTITQFKKR